MQQLKLDLQFFAGEKTEKATPKKREDERKKGKVAKSQDINTALILFFGFILLFVLGTYMKEQMMQLYVESFTVHIHESIDYESVMKLVKQKLVQFGMIVLPMMVVVGIISIASNLLQVGFLFTSEPLKLDLKKINPISGAKRIFSVRAIVELAKSMFKIALIGTITFSVIWINKDEMMMLALKDAENAVAFFGQTTIIMGVSAAIALLFLAVLDYLYQKYDFEKNIRMSKQDIKDEHKNVEGDPLIKSRMREKQRQIATSRMMAEVPKADVVITNPTHYAIAIKYDEDQASAPYVLAKGTDYIALKIKDIAKEQQIMTVEDKPLARAMYDVVNLNEVIPEDFYQAVAEILAYVYQAEKMVNG